jgi:nucleoid-associated protein YgaU
VFDPTSRYSGIETVKMTVGDDAGGEPRVVSYKRRRIIPSGEALATLVEHAVVQGDRLDNLAARYLGDPEQFWRICDANNVLRPEELTEEVGRVIEIGLPYP